MNPADLSQLLADYQALRAGDQRKKREDKDKDSDLPEMQPAGLQQQRQTFDQPDALWAAFAAHAPQQGWLQFQSHQLTFRDDLPAPAAEWGALLQAEAVAEGGLSLSVHRRPQGGWVLTESRHLQAGDLLCDQVRHLVHAAADTLAYRRYWRLDAELGAVQTAACFIGFQPLDSKGA